MTEQRVCRKCLKYTYCEFDANNKPKCKNCINLPDNKPKPQFTDEDMARCERGLHSIKWGIISGTCRRCGEYFEKSDEEQWEIAREIGWA
jgi:hypothetical protein